MKKLLILALLTFPISGLAATQITFVCTPTTRTDGSVMMPAEVSSYSFTGPGVNSASQSSGTYVLPLAKGQTIKAGTVFGCSLTDLFNQVSPAAVTPLLTDAVNTPAKPQAPTVGITIQ